MSLKDNFYQAVKELLNSGGLVGSDLEEKTKSTPSQLDSYLETPTPVAAPGAEIPAYQRPAMPQQPPSSVEAPVATPQPVQQAPVTPPAATGFTQQVPPPPPAPVMPPVPQTSNYGPAPEMTLISKNTLVDGNIRTFANISIEGNVRGDVDSVKDAHITGKMVGSMKCNNMTMQGSSVQGDMLTKGRVIMDRDSVLLGDMAAQYADINGKIKGNLEVAGKVEFRPDSVILGDIKTSAITVMDGANIQGFVNTSYLMENASRVFPGQIIINEEEEPA